GSAAGRSPSTAAGRRSTPKRSRARSRIIPRSSTRWSWGCPTNGSANGSLRWSHSGTAPRPPSTSWSPRPGRTSPVTRCRAARGSSTPSSVRRRASPTTAGPRTRPSSDRPTTTTATAPAPPESRRTMQTDLGKKFGIEYPIFGVTPSEHVAAAISRAGGLGVLGCVRFNDPDELDAVLTWMDENTDGKPYGVDIVMPAKVPTEGTAVDLDKLIPAEHRAFVNRTLDELGVPPLSDDVGEASGVLGWLHSVARSHVDVALA